MEQVQVAPERTISIDRTVEWVETDASGHQHNSVVIRWIEAAEAELMRILELEDYFPNAPRVQHTVNYTGMLWFGQRAHTDLWIERIGKTSLTFGFQIMSYEHNSFPGAEVANGTVTTAYVPQGATGAQPWPAEMRQKFEQVAR